jgi:hypothetical protein
MQQTREFASFAFNAAQKRDIFSYKHAIALKVLLSTSKTQYINIKHI